MTRPDPAGAARSPTGRLDSARHQAGGCVSLSGVGMCFTLKRRQPAQLVPRDPRPTRRGRGRWRGGPRPRRAPRVRRSPGLGVQGCTRSFCRSARTEAARLVPDTGAGAGTQTPAAAPPAGDHADPLCLSFPVWPQGVQNRARRHVPDSPMANAADGGRGAGIPRPQPLMGGRGVMLQTTPPGARGRW